MKKQIFVGAVLALFAVGAEAQGFSKFLPATHEFIAAVRDRNGTKLNQVLGATPERIIDTRAPDGDIALNITIARSDHDWTAFLINKGANPNLAGKGGDTPLIVASRVGFGDAVGWLLKAGAKVDLTNRMGETALIAAVQQRQVPIVRRLLEAGADPDKADSAAGYTARDYAARDNRSRQISLIIESKKPKAAAAGR